MTPASHDAQHQAPHPDPTPTPVPTATAHPDRSPPPIPTQQQSTTDATAVPIKPALTHGYIPITTYLQPASSPTAGNVSIITKMIRDYTPDHETQSTRTDVMTLHADDTVHIVWIQEDPQTGILPFWAYANLIQTNAEGLYKSHTIQALVDQHARSNLETTRLLNTIEQTHQAHYATTAENIADLKQKIQHHLDQASTLNDHLREQIAAYQAAHDDYNPPDEGRAY